ncbi:MAG: outer membrane beta-barrel protein [Aliarcobacter skirrowii]|uniref:outer membrane protein n=1 Tax=Aliarcobacter skirrowii TaxID=28200 RepID=UPI002431AD19|nr:outer membrane beta-barrel protein [Aliarcobacter skirrowii]MDD2507427.1 outer membrane beta-barrel protein [Aliarcobacter skirrowii]MDD3495779.1 outer membrane beta-barrel protein [Aliarcobacter skirrowii]
MKKLVTAGIVASTLLLTNASADTKWYAGVEVGSASNTTELELERYGISASVDVDNNYKDIKFVVGKGTGDDWYTQLYLSKITYDKGHWFSKDDKALEIGFETMKQFKVHEKVYPFLKFGLGIANMDTDQTKIVDSLISAVSLTLGAGVDFKVTENISILGGLDYNYKSWQDAEDGTDTISTSDSGTRFYVGANYRF